MGSILSGLAQCLVPCPARPVPMLTPMTEALEERVRAAFAERYGFPPEVVASAPGRVNLIGEHTDYNAGLALPIAIPMRTYAACSPRTDGLLRIGSAQAKDVIEVPLAEVAPGHPAGWAAYVAGVPWAMREAGYDVGGLDVFVDSAVPLGAGLSSSAALECAVGAGLSALHGLALLDSAEGRARLADVCRVAENVIAGAPTGGMDQAAAMLCEPGRALLLDCRSGATEQVPFDLAAHGLALLVTDTRAHHELTDGQYGARRDACEQAAAELGLGSLREVPAEGLEQDLARLSRDELVRRVRHVVTEIERVRECVAALRADDFARVGALFLASHASLRDDYEVSAPELDLVVEVAMAQGALGARMTGGGFGGSALSLVAADAVEETAAALARAFRLAGFGEPRSWAVGPGPSAFVEA
jgi:galactokinase